MPAAMRRPAERDWIALEGPDKRLSGVPGVRWHASDRAWIAHVTHLPLLDRENLARVQDAEVDVMEGGFRDFEVCATTLRPHQISGAAFARSRFGTLIGDEMRVGKTATAIATHDLREGQLMVVGPLASRGVWLSWMKRRWPDIEPTILLGRKPDVLKIKSSSLLFIHFDILRSWQSIGFLDLGTLVIDEIHLLGSLQAGKFATGSARWRGVGVLATQAKRIVGLTGTPVWNRPAGCYNFLSLLNPGAWGTFREFTSRYANAHPGAHGWEIEGPSHEDEFQRRLSEVMIARKWRDIAPDLPPVNVSVELVPLKAKELTQLELEIQSAYANSTARRATVGDESRLRVALGMLKAPQATHRALDYDEPAVVWCWHKAVVQKVSTLLVVFGRAAYPLHGDMNVDQREHQLNRWREDPCGVLVATIGVGQVAIDLSHARHAIFCEASWTPSEVSQALMRTFSPARPMTAVFLVADHWFDRRLVKSILKKCRDAARLGLAASETPFEVFEEVLDADLDEDMELLELFGNWDVTPVC